MSNRELLQLRSDIQSIHLKISEVDKKIDVTNAILKNADVMDMRSHVNFMRKLPKAIAWVGAFIGSAFGIWTSTKN